jgi:hypothetical protein
MYGADVPMVRFQSLPGRPFGELSGAGWRHADGHRDPPADPGDVLMPRDGPAR